MEIKTIIDGQPFLWHASGDFRWGEGGQLCRLADDPLLPRLGEDGYRTVDLPSGCAELLAARVAELLNLDRLEMYHGRIDDAGHEQAIHKNSGPSLRRSTA